VSPRDRIDRRAQGLCGGLDAKAHLLALEGAKAKPARRAIEGRQQLELSVRGSEAFAEALLHPKPVNQRLRDTVRRYRDATDS